MSLDSFVRVTAIPECFERLQADAERLKGDIERLQRFVELMMAKSSCASVVDPVPASVPQPSTPEPVEMESSARQRLELNAQAAATQMVERVTLMHQQKQSTATSLAYALRAAQEASADFQCPRTMDAILKALDEMDVILTARNEMDAILTALDGMDAAAREEQSNG
jgi:hypothetical protein